MLTSFRFFHSKQLHSNYWIWFFITQIDRLLYRLIAWFLWFVKLIVFRQFCHWHRWGTKAKQYVCLFKQNKTKWKNYKIL
jgi:hypothetical protein